MNHYNAIVIGGGHNGLTCAAYLARAGRKVLVLEKRPLVGGATVTEEIVPGFKFTVFSYLVSLLRTEVINELDLVKHGLMLLPFESTLDMAPNGDFLYREADHYRTYRNMARHSRRDAEAYDDFKLTIRHIAHAVRYLMNHAPPNLDFAGADAAGIADLARHMLGLDKEVLHTFIQLMTMSAVDFLDQWFENDLIKAALCTSGLIGTLVGPRSPGSALVLLYHYIGELDGVYRTWRFAKGGTGGVANALASAAKSFGAEIRVNTGVARLLLQNGTAKGVVLESGEEIYADTVVSSLTPQLSYLKFAGEANLPAGIVQQAKRWNSFGSAGKVNLALDGVPEFKCMPGKGEHHAGAFSFNVSLDGMERAFDEAKYGNFSRTPYIDAGLISVADPDMAPPGKHVMTCFVMYAPYKLAQGNWNDQRQAFGDNVIDNLEQYIPNIRKILVGRQVNTPLDIEQRIGISGGNIFHGELRLDQMFANRPVPGQNGFQTPLHNYYICGSSAHPGGAISGAPGRLAAMQILRNED
ncbi:MAG: NAD(P)/FAD-dependent oxidoreductase [Caldilineaceae bacterium]